MQAEFCGIQKQQNGGVPEIILNIIVSICNGGKVHIAGRQIDLVWQLLYPPLQLIEDVDVVIHNQPVIGQEAPSLWLSSLDTLHQFL